jgi:NAD(P)-dependent dehydrogenase (short-subunit alcohol dehydrogenase family)
MAEKVVVITGAARGIGRACVNAFLDDGAQVAALDLSWETTGVSGDMDDSYYEYLRSRTNDVLMVTCDIADTSQVQSAFDQTIEKFGTVDFLYNNAGMRMRNLYPPAGRGITTLHTNRVEWQQMFDVTVFGAIELTKLFIQPMIEKHHGSILTTISSGALHHSHGGAYMALRPNSREVPYQPAKAAIQSAMFYLADEVAEFNVAVNTLIPGHTRTTGFDEQNASRSFLSSKDAGAPTARPGARPANVIAVSPDHVVPLVKFLSQQDASGGVTGRSFDTMSWNIEHGFGSWDVWADSGAEQGIRDALQRIAALEAT